MHWHLFDGLRDSGWLAARSLIDSITLCAFHATLSWHDRLARSCSSIVRFLVASF